MLRTEIFDILNSFSNSTAAAIIEDRIINIGDNISNIINSDGDEKTDGECLDEIIEYLRREKLYKERK